MARTSVDFVLLVAADLQVPIKAIQALILMHDLNRHQFLNVKICQVFKYYQVLLHTSSFMALEMD